MKILAILGMLALASCSPFSSPEPRSVNAEIAALYGTQERALVHKPVSIEAVYSFDASDTRIDYDEGTDYEMTENGIRRLSGSDIYDFSSYSLPLDANGQFEWVDDPRNPPLAWHDQVYVDYTARADFDTIPGLASSAPSGRLIVAGDSIAFGAHTVNDGRYRSYLADYFSGQITVEGVAVVGATLTGLLTELPTILADPPKYITIAYGMNDHSAGPAGLTDFQDDLSDAVDQLKTEGVNVILVGFPHKNKLWENYVASDVIGYNAAIEAVANEHGVPFVDIAGAFEQLREVKDAIEIFGDNYHHPSSYGQRIYFSKILPYFIDKPVSESQVSDYLRVP